MALKKLEEPEKAISSLGDNPYIGTTPKYNILKRQGYLVLILEKDIVSYKINEEKKIVTIYAIVDNREDYSSIFVGL